MNTRRRVVATLTVAVACAPLGIGAVTWERMSSMKGLIPIPNEGTQQTCCVVCDIDKDGKDDFVVGERTRAPSVVWYRFNGKRFERFVIDNTRLKPEAGGAVCDVDGDGDMDLILGQDASGNAMWWWENPRPTFGKPWKRHAIDTLPARSMFIDGADRNDLADVNGDGRLDAIVALENGTDVYWFEAPSNAESQWTRHLVGTVAGQGFSMDTDDLDGDGDPDIVIGEHRGKKVNRVVIFENARRGAQWPLHVVDSDSPKAIDHHDGTVLLDIDGDSDLDIVSIGWYNPKI